MKKFAEDIIILHMCTKNHNHMMYGSWDTEWNRQKKLSLCLMIPNIRILKKKETNAWRYYHFTHVYYKLQSYDPWSLRYGACDWQTFLSLWAVFFPITPHPPPSPNALPNNPKKQNFERKKKIPGYIIILHMCTINGNYMMHGSEIWSVTDKIFSHFGLFFTLLPT